MPSGVYPRTKEHCENIRKSKLGNKNSMFDKKPWNKDKHIRTNTGKTHFKKGHISWVKGTNIQTNTGRTHFKKGQIGEKASNWKGGRVKDSNGYILIYKPNHPFARNNYILEHRLVVEKAIGRYLLPKEPVHHINGIKNDNRLENLIAFNRQYAHIKYHHIQEGIKKGEIIFNGFKKGR